MRCEWFVTHASGCVDVCAHSEHSRHTILANADSVRGVRSVWTNKCNRIVRSCVMETETESLRKLVQLYENNRVLWDSKDPNYYNKCKREDSWRQISQHVNIPVKDLKKKIQSLTGSFRREKSRVKKSQVTGSGADGTYISKWFGYTWFQFLYDKDIPKNTIDSDSQYPQENFDPSLNEETQDGSASPTNTSTIASNSQTIHTSDLNLNVSEAPSTSSDNTANMTRANKRPKKRRAAAINEDIALEDAYNILKKTSEISNDHYDSFGQHVANELRKYDPRIVPYVKKALLDVLFQADIGQFHQHSRGYYTPGYNSSPISSPHTSTPLSSLTTQANPVPSNPPNLGHQPLQNDQNITMEFSQDSNPDATHSADPFAMSTFSNYNADTCS